LTVLQLSGLYDLLVNNLTQENDAIKISGMAAHFKYIK